MNRTQSSFIRVDVPEDDEPQQNPEGSRLKPETEEITITWVLISVLIVCCVLSVVGFSSWYIIAGALANANAGPATSPATAPAAGEIPRNSILMATSANAPISNVVISQSTSAISAIDAVPLPNRKITLPDSPLRVLRRETGIGHGTLSLWEDPVSTSTTTQGTTRTVRLQCTVL